MFVISAEFDAPCDTAEPTLFYSQDPEQVEQAKALCRTCRIQLICLEQTLEFEALGKEPLHAVRGGLTEAERRQTKITRIA